MRAIDTFVNLCWHEIDFPPRSTICDARFIHAIAPIFPFSLLWRKEHMSEFVDCVRDGIYCQQAPRRRRDVDIARSISTRATAPAGYHLMMLTMVLSFALFIFTDMSRCYLDDIISYLL